MLSSLRRATASPSARGRGAAAPHLRHRGLATLSAESVYARMHATLAALRSRNSGLGALTLAEKILYSKIAGLLDAPIVRGESYLKLNPDRVAMQDASAQMAILQFMLAGVARAKVPTSIHCDHLIQATGNGAEPDLTRALGLNKEIFDFLEAAATKYGMDFWKPGSGIIHQLVLENYAQPGALILGTDSHTPNGGGLGCLAIGVGGADAVDGMVGIPWELKSPRIIGVELTGKLSGWATAKDVILTLVGELTVSGGTNHVIEYFGDGARGLSCTGMATICNMGAEVGATTSVFPYSARMAEYLRATGRGGVAEAADAAERFGLLRADDGCEYDKVVRINLDSVEPQISGPFSPDLATPISQFWKVVQEKGWKDEVSAGLIGSCTNSSYEDMTRAVDIARQASSRGIVAKSKFFVSPGSEQIRATIERDGITRDFDAIDANVLANACGPCIGQWARGDAVKKDEENAILTSFNRNFRGRNDGNSKTMNFLASPEIVTAMTISGKLTFNPLTDTLKAPNGTDFQFSPPAGLALPPNGFTPGRVDFKPSLMSDNNPTIHISPTSTRLQRLTPFSPWGGDLNDAKVLLKVQGKCTTDHISAAGAWLKYKGHLENIAENTLIGATNAFTGKVNLVLNELTGSLDSVPTVAKEYRDAGVEYIVVSGLNYGEGSAREHAALQPRFLGCRVIVAQSFARIHETNLKKQGVVPLTFVDRGDYDRIVQGCRVSTKGLASTSLAPESKVSLVVTPPSGATFSVELKHTLSQDQIGWVRAGSALNLIAQQSKN